MRRALVLSLLLLATWVAPAAHAQDATGLDSISAEYHDLVALFYKQVDPHVLLQAAWSALASEATRRGAQAPDALPSLPDDPEAAFAAFANAYSTYVQGLPPSFTAATAATDVDAAMAESLHEQHTHYLPPALLRQFLSTVGGGQQSIGLGIRLGSDPTGLIAEIAPGGPAANAGLRAGDVIVAVDGKDFSGSDTPSLAAALVGSQDTTVTLSIDRGDGPQEVQVTRGPFYFPPLDSRVLPGGVGYLRLSDFVISGTTLPNGSELLSDLDRRLDDLDAQGAQSVILDLRNNSGGSVQTADEVLGRFLPENALTVRQSDERGHVSFDVAGGRQHARQWPMAVMINGGSASASEVTAAAMRDAHRAVLVGQETLGAVASSELLPLPGGGGLQVAVASATDPATGAPLDGVGVAPDVVTTQSKTLDDYRSGHDPQLDAAIVALGNSPTPTAPNQPTPAISTDQLDQLFAGLLPDANDLPTNDRLTRTDRWQRLDYTHPNELIDQNGGAADPVALQQTLRSRGYQGTVMASYGARPGDLPTVSVNADLYATADGAHEAASTNDLPELQQPTDAPAQIGDDTVAYRGLWLATGSSVVIWRRGRVVYTVTYSDVPGLDRPDTLAAIAQFVDGRAQQLSIPQ